MRSKGRTTTSSDQQNRSHHAMRPENDPRGRAPIEEKVVSEEPVGLPGDPCVMVIFGPSGDLAKRKLIPALYNLARENLLSRQFAIVGSARRPMTNEEFRDKLTQEMKEFATGLVDSDLWEWLARRLYYLPGDGQDPDTYRQLKELLAKIDQEHGTPGNYFYYLATAPGLFSGVIQQLGTAGLTREENGRWRRVIIEKPFGHDFASAQALNQGIRQVLHERQIYRIDQRTCSRSSPTSLSAVAVS
jgi:glucose-6-phosphate 1-dehydrogenase